MAPETVETLVEKIENLTTLVKNVNQKLDKAESRMSAFESQLTDMSVKISEMSKCNDEMNTTLKNFSKNVCAVEKRMTDCEMKLNNLDKMQKLVSDRLVKLETYSRRDNLLLDGVPEAASGVREDCKKLVLGIIANNLKLPDIDGTRIVSCYRSGPPPSQRQRKNNVPRSILFQLQFLGDRERIWKARFNLRGSKMFINEDFPQEVQQRRKTLFPVLKHVQKSGKGGFLRGDRLHITEKNPATNFNKTVAVVDVDSLDKLLPAIDVRYITTKQNKDCFIFFGELCPLSNFHRVTVTYKYMTFPSSEHVFQYRRAEFVDDQVACANIKKAMSPLEAKRIGDNVATNPAWQENRERIMKETLRLKFQQNPAAKDFLMNISQQFIAESSPSDAVWGTGYGLEKDGATNPNLWGSNILGKVMCELRAEFS